MASGLRERVGTGLLLAALVIVILAWLPPAVAVGAVMLAVALGAWEWAGFAGIRSTAGRSAYAGAVVAGIALAWYLTGGRQWLAVFLAAAAAWWFAALLWLVLAPAQGESFRMEGRVLKPGRTITVCEGRAYALASGHEKLVATMGCTLMTVTGRQEIKG